MAVLAWVCADALAASDEVAANRACDQWGSADFFEMADVAAVARCLETRDPNETRDGAPAWFGAARGSSDPNVVRMLIESGADTAAKDEHGNSALHAAVISNRHPAVLAALVAAGVDVSVTDKQGWLPVQLAALHVDGPQALKVLLEGGADATARTGTGQTLLHLAAGYNKSVEVLQFLLENGADPRARRNDGSTPLHDAVGYSEDAAVVRALLSGGADPDARSEHGNAPLHRLVWRPINRFFRDDDVERERRFLDQALAIAEALLEAGANPNAVNDSGDQPLKLVVEVSSLGDHTQAVAEALVDAGADLGDGSLLYFAAQEQDAEFVQFLLAAGVSREQVREALVVAAHYGDDPAVIDLLLEAGADVNWRDPTFTTALHAAARRTDGGQMIRRLVRGGANPEVRETIGWTPLHTAALWDYDGKHAGESLIALLDAGANPLARDEDGRTPWDLARENEALRGSEAYWRLNDARFASTPATEDGEGIDPD